VVAAVSAHVEQLPVTLNMEETRRQLGGVSKPTIYKWVKQGKLRRVDLPGVFLVSTESVLKLVNGGS
jgi:predicted site-specific integrase-resolvase